MPLRDHFRSPVNDAHSWDELHGQWPGEIVRHLQTILPPGFRASPRVQLGGGFEVDIGAHELDSPLSDFSRETGGTATLAAPAPTYTVDADLLEQDEYEVRILDTERGRTLVAAIEIVSPANKVRPSKRDLFVSKCLALLQQDICVSIVDLVSIRQANLYAELLQRIGRADPKLGDAPPHLYSVSLRNRPDTPRRPLLDAWFYPMTVDCLFRRCLFGSRPNFVSCCRLTPATKRHVECCASNDSRQVALREAADGACTRLAT